MMHGLIAIAPQKKCARKINVLFWPSQMRWWLKLQAADDIVIAVPSLQFYVPAAFKAWIDLICRTNITYVLRKRQATGHTRQQAGICGNHL